MIALDSGDKIQGDASNDAVVDYVLSGTDANAIKQLADGQLSDTPESDLYTADSVDAVTGIILVNTHNSAVTVNLFLLPFEGAARRIIPKDMTLGIGSSLHTNGQTIVVLDASGQVLSTWAVHDTPVNGIVAIPISSNWAYDHVAAADPHTGYVLESLADAEGDMFYASGNDAWARLAKGSDDEVLTLASGVPIWAEAASVAADVQTFNSTDTWTKPADITLVYVECIGGGGGGGGAEGRATSNDRVGGNGGGGAALIGKLLIASDLGGTEDVVIGAAGTGGTGGTNNDGGNGGNGGDTYFGANKYVWAGGGGDGVGGASVYSGEGGCARYLDPEAAETKGYAGRGAGISESDGQAGFDAEYGGASGGATNNPVTSSNSGAGGNSAKGGGGAGAGGSVHTVETERAAGAGGASGNTAGGAAGATGGGAGTVGTAGNSGTAGGGGGGGGAGNSETGGVGGAGGIGGGGGGGGGGGTTTGGNGGAGGVGQIKIWSW